MHIDLVADGDGLDLMSYVEFQRNYLACVRAHKAALMTQRTFWNSLLKDNISFRDLQVCCNVLPALCSTVLIQGVLST